MHVAIVAELVQYDPAGHVPSDVEPEGQYAPVFVHVAIVAELVQYEPAGHVP